MLGFAANILAEASWFHHLEISWSPIVLQGARYSSRDYTYYTMTLTGKKLTEDVYQPFPGSTALMM